MQVAYSNGNAVSPDVDVCGYPLAYPLRDDPVYEVTVTALGGITVVFEQASVEKGRAVTDRFGYFVIVLEEGTYDISITGQGYDDFNATITLAAGQRAPFIGYRLVRPAGTWPGLIITPEQVRTHYLFGLLLIDIYGRPFTDDQISWYIRECQAKCEVLTHIDINHRKVIATSEDVPNPGDYDIIEPGYDYSFNDFMNWAYFKLRRQPLIKKVKDISLVYPIGRTVLKIPPEWIRTYYRSSQVQVVPAAGAVQRIFLLPDGSYGPLVSWYLPGQIPQVSSIVYETGLVDSTGNPNPYISANIVDLVKHIVGLEAAIEVLGVTGDALRAGIASQSISGDGISESYSTTASATSATYQARIESYRKDLQGRSAGESGLYGQLKDFFASIDIVVC